MNLSQLKELIADFNSHEDAIMHGKGKEYADEADRLRNFKEVAEFVDLMPAQVALLYMMKHIQSISKAVNEGPDRWCWQDGGGEGLKQRIADARNYLLLIAACLEEEVAEGDTTDG